jgi:hypothetical protein
MVSFHVMRAYYTTQGLRGQAGEEWDQGFYTIARQAEQSTDARRYTQIKVLFCGHLRHLRIGSWVFALTL